MRIFTKDFLEYSEQNISDHLDKNGYFSYERALSNEFINAIFESVDTNRFSINTNWISGVYTEQQYYLTHMLAVSKEFYSYATHDKIMSISKKILGDKIRLKAMRYYETMGNHRMQWHTDNKTDKGFAHIPGIIFICYLVDVYDGEFQYVSGSHEWSGIRAYSDYSDSEIEEKFQDQIVSFKKPAGSIIIYNTYGVHRAKPAEDKRFTRKSLFFQVDSDVNSAEPLILNPAFCDNLTDDRKDYLGFGMNSNYQIFPNSKFKNHPVTPEITKQILSWLGYRLIHNLPTPILKLLKKSVKSIL
jgi:ectoine hydroxylase-related dioxygenase (phytanoyl-CoA dioxygenase family)